MLEILDQEEEVIHKLDEDVMCERASFIFSIIRLTLKDNTPSTDLFQKILEEKILPVDNKDLIADVEDLLATSAEQQTKEEIPESAFIVSTILLLMLYLIHKLDEDVMCERAWPLFLTLKKSATNSRTNCQQHH